MNFNEYLHARTPLRPSSRVARTTVLSYAILMFLLMLAAIVPAGAEDSVFGEAVDVRVVNLEVVVEERGERVRGLTPDDFVLEVDGQVMPIQFFTEVADGTAVQSIAAADAGGAAPKSGEQVPTSYLVFIDEFFTEPVDRDRTVRGMIDELSLLQATDQMAVVAFDGQSVDMLADWSSNADALATTLQRAMDRPTHGLKWRLEERTYETNRLRRLREESRLYRPGQRINTPLRDSLNPLAAGLSVEERQFASRIEDATEHASRSAAAALRGFAQPEGRKVLILLSGGWPSEAARWVVPDLDRRFERNGLLQGNRLLDPLTETANLLGYSIYAVDMPGIDAITVDAGTATVNESNSIREVSRQREQEEEFGLIELAERTGGKALLDGARETAFSRVVDDTRTYYWLGFSPTWQENDSRHKVKVRVARKGPKVRARSSFLDLSESTRISMLTESALLFRGAPDAYPLTATFGPSERRRFGKREVPLTVDIPVNEVTFLPTAEGFTSELELRVAVVDEHGNRAEIPVVPITYETERLPEGQEVATYETRVLLRKKEHNVVVSLYDRLSGKLHSTRLTLASL